MNQNDDNQTSQSTPVKVHDVAIKTDSSDEQIPLTNTPDLILAPPETKDDSADISETKTSEAAPEQDFSKIEVQQYDAPVKRPLASLEETLGEKPSELSDDLPNISEGKNHHKDEKVVNFRPAAMPPIRANDSNRAVVVTTTVAIAVILAGFGAGFGGYKMLQNQTAAADTAATTEPPKTIQTEGSTSTSPETTKTNVSWNSYANTKYSYSLKYPDTWYGQGTDSATANTIQLTSFKPSTSSTGGISEGYKVEIVFQDTNAKTLKDWVDAHNASMSAKVTTSKDIFVGNKAALEQTLSEPIQSMATYVIHNDKVMIISYYAAEKDFEKGLTTYEDILLGINLNP